MLNIKLILLVCGFSFLVESAPIKVLSTNEMYIALAECKRETEMDLGAIDRALSTTGIYPDNDRYRKFLTCSYKKQGYLSEEGDVMRYDNVIAFLEQFYQREDLERAVEPCRSIREMDSGGLVYKNMLCLLKGLKSIQKLN